MVGIDPKGNFLAHREFTCQSDTSSACADSGLRRLRWTKNVRPTTEEASLGGPDRWQSLVLAISPAPGGGETAAGTPRGWNHKPPDKGTRIAVNIDTRSPRHLILAFDS
jgi:hypothetical protein